MRIIGGSARGRKLAEFKASGIRPTPDRVREALFSILFSRLGGLEGLKILELFAGSGAMSLEAISRGAASAVLVDSAEAAIGLIRENISHCGMAERTRIVRQTAEKVLDQLPAAGPFDLIFMDPPYRKNFIPPLLERIASLQLLAQNGIIAAESARGEDIPIPSGLCRLDTRSYGSSEIHLIGVDTSRD